MPKKARRRIDTGLKRRSPWRRCGNKRLCRFGVARRGSSQPDYAGKKQLLENAARAFDAGAGRDAEAGRAREIEKRHAKNGTLRSATSPGSAFFLPGGFPGGPEDERAGPKKDARSRRQEAIERQCALIGVALRHLSGKKANDNDLSLMRRIDELFPSWPFLGSRRMTARDDGDG